MQEEEIKILLSPRLLTVSPCLVAQMVKNPQVWSLGQEDPLEKGMATYSSILKATFLFPPNSLCPFCLALVAEKTKNLASKSVITVGAVIAEPFRKLPYAEMGRKRIQQNWLFSFFLLLFLPDVKVIDFKWQIQHMAWLWLQSKRLPWKESLELLHKMDVFLLWQVKLYVLLCLFL